jgi:hypothetical protein
MLNATSRSLRRIVRPSMAEPHCLRETLSPASQWADRATKAASKCAPMLVFLASRACAGAILSFSELRSESVMSHSREEELHHG